MIEIECVMEDYEVAWKKTGSTREVFGTSRKVIGVARMILGIFRRVCRIAVVVFGIYRKELEASRKVFGTGPAAGVNVMRKGRAVRRGSFAVHWHVGEDAHAP
jgi:hypothetical protein